MMCPRCGFDIATPRYCSSCGARFTLSSWGESKPKEGAGMPEQAQPQETPVRK